MAASIRSAPMSRPRSACSSRAGSSARICHLRRCSSAPFLSPRYLGPLIERTLIRWTYGKSEAIQILVTFGLFLILEDLQRMVFGVQSLSEDTPMRLLGTSQIGGVVYLNYQILLIALAVIVVCRPASADQAYPARAVGHGRCRRSRDGAVDRHRHQPHLHSGVLARRVPGGSGRSAGDADLRRRAGTRRRHHGARISRSPPSAVLARSRERRWPRSSSVWPACSRSILCRRSTPSRPTRQC